MRCFHFVTFFRFFFYFTLVLIHAQDAEKAEDFWRTYLAGLQTPTPLPSLRSNKKSSKISKVPGKFMVSLDEDKLRVIEQFCQELVKTTTPKKKKNHLLTKKNSLLWPRLIFSGIISPYRPSFKPLGLSYFTYTRARIASFLVRLILAVQEVLHYRLPSSPSSDC